MLGCCGEVTAGLVESTTGFMALVTCGLTAEDRDQLQNPALVLSMGLPTSMLKNTVLSCGICIGMYFQICA